MSSLTVEVNVQNWFWDATDDATDLEAAPEAAIDPNPIAEAEWEAWFRQWLEVLADHLPISPAYELSLRLTDDREIHSLNAHYRQQDRPTDVLAFAALEVEAPIPVETVSEPLYLGDIVISVETAQTQADRQNHSLKQELAWLAAHALLHLVGWDHPDEASLLEMLKKQAVLLQTIGLVSGYDAEEVPISQAD